MVSQNSNILLEVVIIIIFLLTIMIMKMLREAGNRDCHARILGKEAREGVFFTTVTFSIMGHNNNSMVMIIMIYLFKTKLERELCLQQ